MADQNFDLGNGSPGTDPRGMYRSPLRASSRRATLCLGLLGAGALAVREWPLLALLLGLLGAFLVGVPSWAKGGARHLLAVGVVGLGFGVDLETVLAAGGEGLLLSAATLCVVFVGAGLLGRRLGVPRDQCLLLAGGTAICGGSAIAALAPVLRARAPDVAAALAVVFALNAGALLLFPLLGEFLDLDPGSYGVFCALAIHDTSSVVGAASSGGPVALEIATVTKLARALWILPLCLLVALRRREPGVVRPRGFPLPWFLLAFLAAATLATWRPELRAAAPLFAEGTRAFFAAALFAVGLQLAPATLARIGPRALLLGLSLWALVTGLGLLCVV